MAKKVLTESQLMEIVESATREALATLMEGAGWDTMKKTFKRGLNGDMDGVNDSELKRYAKDGDGEVSYDSYKSNKDLYKRKRAASKAADEEFKTAKSDYDKGLIDNDDIAGAQRKKENADRNREVFAARTVTRRPGIIGKGQRAAVVAAGKTGRGLHKAAKTTSDFVHNKIGLEEGGKKTNKR